MEYIIKYTGDILALGYPTELLDAQFAIMELEAREAGRLLEHQQVSCYEPARMLSSLRPTPGRRSPPGWSPPPGGAAMAPPSPPSPPDAAARPRGPPSRR